MLIEVEHLRRTFHSRSGAQVRAVDDVSFGIEAGETVGLVGESGSGKSTIGRCLLALDQPDGGTVHFDGSSIERASVREMRPLRRRMQMVFQDPLGSINPAYTVRRTLHDALRQSLRSREARDERACELLAAVGLDERYLQRRRTQMSGGQLQRVAIARALASEPDFIFLDEPTSALDLSVRGQIINLLADLQEQRGLAYLFTSHDLGVVRFLAHRVIVLYHGQIVEAGTTERVLTDPQHSHTRSLCAAAGLPVDPSPTTKGELP